MQPRASRRKRCATSCPACSRNLRQQKLNRDLLVELDLARGHDEPVPLADEALDEVFAGDEVANTDWIQRHRVTPWFENPHTALTLARAALL